MFSPTPRQTNKLTIQHPPYFMYTHRHSTFENLYTQGFSMIDGSRRVTQPHVVNTHAPPCRSLTALPPTATRSTHTYAAITVRFHWSLGPCHPQRTQFHQSQRDKSDWKYVSVITVRMFLGLHCRFSIWMKRLFLGSRNLLRAASPEGVALRYPWPV